MDWLHVVLTIVGIVGGYLMRHYQTPATHNALDDAIDAARKSKAIEDIKAAIGVGKDNGPIKPA